MNLKTIDERLHNVILELLQCKNQIDALRQQLADSDADLNDGEPEYSWNCTD